MVWQYNIINQRSIAQQWINTDRYKLCLFGNDPKLARGIMLVYSRSFMERSSTDIAEWCYGNDVVQWIIKTFFKLRGLS